jgi:hypothetical protein
MNTTDVVLHIYVDQWQFSFMPLNISCVEKTFQVGPSGRAVWDVGLNRLDAEIVDLNTVYGMDLCLFVFCCLV